MRRVWTLELVYASGPASGLYSMLDFAGPMWARAYAVSWPIGWPPCAASYEKDNMWLGIMQN